jgi:hypothetical protein
VPFKPPPLLRVLRVASGFTTTTTISAEPALWHRMAPFLMVGRHLRRGVFEDLDAGPSGGEQPLTCLGALAGARSLSPLGTP